MTGHANAPVVVKRPRKAAEAGHHGGARKVAYADFVTAMMAFFMLMWLLGATTEKQRKGIADYFNPTIPVVRASGGGSGAFGGDSAFSESTLTQIGTGAGLGQPTEERQARGDLGVAEADAARAGAAELAELERALHGRGGESHVSELLRRHVVTRLSDEGLVIELHDTAEASLFTPDGVPAPILADLLETIVPMLDLVVNPVAIQAHLPAVPVVRRVNPTWADSTRRANLVRELVQARGLPAERIARITGFGDRNPVTANPMAGRNSRLELVVLRATR